MRRRVDSSLPDDRWDRCGDEFAGVFEESEIEVLRGYAEGLPAFLDDRADSYSSIVLGGDRVVAVPDEAATDRGLLAILRNELGEREPNWVLASSEARCLGAGGGSLRAVDVAGHRGRMRLPSPVRAEMWIRVTWLSRRDPRGDRSCTAGCRPATRPGGHVARDRLGRPGNRDLREPDSRVTREWRFATDVRSPWNRQMPATHVIDPGHESRSRA